MKKMNARNEELLLRNFIRESIEQNNRRQINELGTAGHLALDAIGFVPGIGEAADLLNAIAYIKEGEYLFAAFSFISMVPEIGDVIGKGGKLATWLGKVGGKTGAKAGKVVGEVGEQAIKVAKWLKDNIGQLNQAIVKAAAKFDAFKKDEKVQTAAKAANLDLESIDLNKEKDNMIKAAQDWLKDFIEGNEEAVNEK